MVPRVIPRIGTANEAIRLGRRVKTINDASQTAEGASTLAAPPMGLPPQTALDALVPPPTHLREVNPTPL